MQSFKPIYKILTRIPVWLACAALFALMVMTFFDVILRSSFDAPIEAATELTRIFTAVMVFSVMPHISVTGSHIAVDLLDGLFDRLNLSHIQQGLVLLVSGLMMYWPVKQVWKLAERTRDYGDVTEYLGLPQYWTMWFIGAGITLAAIAMVIAALLHFFAPRFVEEMDL